MKLQFWGAARTVTGSMHLLEVNGKRLLLDCGLYQGHRKAAFEQNRTLPFPAVSIDAVVLSHAHIDHTGNLPTLVRGGFRGLIHSTAATQDLCGYMLMDSAHIQEQDVRYVNKRRAREGRRAFEPLYTGADAAQTLKRFRSVPYEKEFEPIQGVKVHFRDAGHMLGSAVVVLDITEKRKTTRLIFSGDIGRHGLPILRDPQTTTGARYVIMECTYGNRLHESEADAEAILLEAVKEVFDRGGKLLIPAFAVGRTQEILYHLNSLFDAGKLPPIDVFVDSPLAANVTDVFLMHPECFDSEMVAKVYSGADHDPLGFSRLRTIRTVEDSKRLNHRLKPAVIIAASGMCEAGRILHHLENGVSDSRNTILFVGYQAEHTLGRRLLDGVSPVSIFGQDFQVRAKIKRADAYSAHADQAGLLDWITKTQAQGTIERVFLVHCEDPASTVFAGELKKRGFHAEIPNRGHTFELT